MFQGWARDAIADKPVDVLAPPGARAAVLFLHAVGLESPADSAAYSAAFTKHNLACVAPHGARSWWSDRVCPEFDDTLTAERHLLDNVRPWMADRWRPIAAAGISMGGQGAVRLGFKHPELFPVVASVAGAFDYHELYGRGTPIDVVPATTLSTSRVCEDHAPGSSSGGRSPACLRDGSGGWRRRRCLRSGRSR